ncbi:unnamed protein product [Microthlaspi erraticum]|uniref:At1g61320/AtMIF1 LRR domain-containing protein n=1 Tax=Microthlaspi erraticum TaxID=1685480 RepID=A0A6D2J1B5_9BRAS|nr:unnamed protein product [Microthlaspi erraticum]
MLCSWTSLKKLSFRFWNLSDDTMAKILSVCPILESLTLYFCNQLNVLDLSTSQHLRTLEVVRDTCFPGPMEIVAPPIHCLRLRTSRLPCTLVDVSSLTEAKLNILFKSVRETLQAGFLLQANVVNMLEKLMHVEKLTIGGNFLQNVSPGVEKILQKSPDLKKLTLRTETKAYIAIPNDYFYKHIVSQGLNPNQCWKSKDGASWNTSHWNLNSEHVASFVELLLKNTKSLEKLGLQLNEGYCRFKELVPTFSHNKKCIYCALSQVGGNI